MIAKDLIFLGKVWLVVMGCSTEISGERKPQIAIYSAYRSPFEQVKEE